MELINEKEKLVFVKEKLKMNTHIFKTVDTKNEIEERLDDVEKDFITKTLKYYDNKFPYDFKKYTDEELSHLSIFADNVKNYLYLKGDKETRKKVDNYIDELKEKNFYDMIKNSEASLLNYKYIKGFTTQIPLEEKKLKALREEIKFNTFNKNPELKYFNEKGLRYNLRSFKIKDYPTELIRLIFSYTFVPSTHILKDIYHRKFYWERKVSELDTINTDLYYVNKDGFIKEEIYKEIEKLENEYLIKKYNFEG
ncbi:hypothetical protein [Virgibacillus sp. DJP39]|uniref:hypothetical protein n=1 Tax=Virgibacillus sp. DJP39 TaxID=3409790 RepID=UPI003BB64592